MNALDWSSVSQDPRFATLCGHSVLVTGGFGFIGSHLTDALLALGCRVSVFDSLVTGKPGNLAHLFPSPVVHKICEWQVEAKKHGSLPHAIMDACTRQGKPVRLFLGDVRDSQLCRKACEGVSFVFHQAALGSVPESLEHPGETMEVNVAGTARLFEAARDARVRRVIYASSSSVYGDSEKLPKKEGEEGNPLSPYALSKVMNERLAEIFTRCYGMEFVGLRYFNVYGPRQDPDGPYAAVIPSFFKACRNGEAPVIYGDGEQTRDFTFVTDAVRANLLASTAARRSGTFNVASGCRITINSLAMAVIAAVGISVEPLHREGRPGDIRHSWAHLGRAKSMLSYAPQVQISVGVHYLNNRS